jgi:hypothetical protein
MATNRRARWGRPLAVYLLALIAVGLLSGSDGTPLGEQILMRMFWNCFVNKWGLLTMACTTAFCAALGWPAIKCLYRRMLANRKAMGCAVSMVLCNLLAGMLLFQTGSFTHAMLSWGFHDYLQTMGTNMMVSFVLSAMIIWRAGIAWSVARWKLPRTLLASAAIMQVNYMFATLAYFGRPFTLIE